MAHEFINRLTNVDYINTDLQHFLNWVQENHPNRYDFDEYVFKSGRLGFIKMLQSGVLYNLPCMNKYAFLSTYIDAVMKLHRKFRLTESQLIDICLPIVWMTEFTKFHSIISRWIKEGIPAGNDLLCVKLAREAKESCGNIMSGKHPRTQPHVTKDIDTSIVAENFEHAVETIGAANKKKKLNYNTFCSEMKSGIEFAGDFTVQHLVHVLLAVGVVRHPYLGSEANLALSTVCAARLKERYGISSDQAELCVVSISLATGLTKYFVENALCEMLKFFPVSQYEKDAREKRKKYRKSKKKHTDPTLDEA